MGIIMSICIDDEITELKKSGDIKIDYNNIIELIKNEINTTYYYCQENLVSYFY